MSRPRLGLEQFRRFHFGSELGSRVGTGEIGGKAAGLCRMAEALRATFPDSRIDGMQVSIPHFVVIATDVFDDFITQNALRDTLAADLSDEEIALRFQQAELPAEIVGDLRALIEEIHTPLAVRSSSMLEDALEQPFAGVYETKMIPNNAPELDVRFQRLTEAIKFVYATTFFRAARTYRQACGVSDAAEKMAVVLQQLVGVRYGDRFYPHVSAVGRSYSYYPIAGTRPEDGFASLALGLGKTIVDGGLCWSYSPRYPRKPPPFGSVRAMLQLTQKRFWAVAMAGVPSYNPIAETEYLVECDLNAADYDDVLHWIASTYDAASDRLRPGVGSDGPRVLDFAPLLQLGQYPLNGAIAGLLAAAKTALACDVEIELAVVLPVSPEAEPVVNVLQARPMMAPHEAVDVAGLAERGRRLITSARVLGNGLIEDVCDVVYVRPETFELRLTKVIAAELARLNEQLLNARRPYLLIGFGRWGSADPWLGIPVAWGHVAGAHAVVEAALPGVNADPSEGSHFFHNLSSLRVQYFTTAAQDVDWAYLDELPAAYESALIRHVQLAAPLLIAADGRSQQGIIVQPTE